MLRSTYRRVRLLVAILAIAVAAFLVSVVTIDLGPSLKARAETEGSKLIDRPMHIGKLSVHIARGRRENQRALQQKEVVGIRLQRRPVERRGVRHVLFDVGRAGGEVIARKAGRLDLLVGGNRQGRAVKEGECDYEGGERDRPQGMAPETCDHQLFPSTLPLTARRFPEQWRQRSALRGPVAFSRQCARAMQNSTAFRSAALNGSSGKGASASRAMAP